MDKLIITVAPCAPPAQLEAYPDLPRTPEQIADEVVRAWNAGAAIAHLHVLDEQGHPTQDLAAFRRTIALIRERCDILIEGSTGGLTGFSAAERSVALQADIDLASLNPGSVNYDRGVYINSPQDIDYWVGEMHRRGIKPGIAIFEVGMIENALRYVRQGLISEPLFFNFVLGQVGALPATARNLVFLIESVPSGSMWEVTGHGGHDLQAALWAIALGGHARAGFEDNIFYRPGERASSNAMLIERIVRIAREAERPIASPAEVRSMLGI
ncbi:MAG TPA: 3-keto-5-aminohexanoate cleavage protein [Caldilineae bacterium]|nr:3-keto-5-aminohexanoate cleavage protein [Caldilineae bacterium]